MPRLPCFTDDEVAEALRGPARQVNTRVEHGVSGGGRVGLWTRGRTAIRSTRQLLAC